MFDDESIRFKVVANHQEQYSIWPDFKDMPAGWIAVGPQGLKDECLDYIEKVWTDMRPKRLRDKMKEQDAAAPPGDGAKQASQKVVDEFADEVKAYAEGKPELYGWFVARVIEAQPDLDPDEVRRALDDALPPHNIPENYA